MKKKILNIITFLFVGIASMGAQDLHLNEILWVDDGLGKSHIIDKITYSDNALTIITSASIDSLTMDKKLVADTIGSFVNYKARLNSHKRYVARQTTLNGIIITDSLVRDYYMKRINEAKGALDLLRAN